MLVADKGEPPLVDGLGRAVRERGVKAAPSTPRAARAVSTFDSAPELDVDLAQATPAAAKQIGAALPRLVRRQSVMYLQRMAGNQATRGLLETSKTIRRAPAAAPAVIQRVGPTLTLTNVAVTNATPVAGAADHFVTIRGAPAGSALVTATVTSSTGVVPPNSVRWRGGAAGADQTQRLVRPTSAGDKVVTVNVGATRQTVHIHVVQSVPLPGTTPARLRHLLSGKSNPGANFGLTVVTIGTQGIKGPEFDITAHLVGDQWTFRVKEIRHRYKIGVAAQGRRNISGAGDVSPGRLAGVVTDFTPPAPGTPLGPLRSHFWNETITRAHENEHVNHFYNFAAFWPNSMTQFQTETEGATVTYGLGPTVNSAAGVLRDQKAHWKARADFFHNQADAAEIAGSEIHCHGVTNPLYTALLAGIVNAVRPPAPTTLTAAATGATSVQLGWVRAGVNETGYVIQRRRRSGAFTNVAAVGLLPPSFTDATAVANTRYTYRVRAVGAAGNSGFSTAITVTTPP